MIQRDVNVLLDLLYTHNYIYIFLCFSIES